MSKGYDRADGKGYPQLVRTAYWYEIVFSGGGGVVVSGCGATKITGISHKLFSQEVPP